MKLFFLLVLALFISVPARCLEAPLNAKASSLKFTGHAFLHDFDGHAQDFRGSAQIDPGNPNLVTSAVIDIAAAKMTTFEDTRDHPAQFTVQGDFTLNKTTKPLATKVQGWREGRRLVVTGTTSIDTTDYGLPIVRQLFLTVDKKVDISFRLVFDLPPGT